jgi:hypothetical protein
MRITQGYVSKSVDDFPFLSSYNLDEYYDSAAPCIFFGCYRYEDVKIITRHKGLAVIFWCGQDAVDFAAFDAITHCHHATYHQNIYQLLKDKVKIHLLYPRDFGSSVEITPLGDKIYAYVPATAPTYHGSEIIKQLKKNYEIIIGDGTIPQDQWRGGRCNEFYNPSFIGLMLSSFAGGGSSIVEMGLRGRKCVTNVFNLPHTITWETVEDVEHAIETEAANIGMVNNDLASEVSRFLDTGEFLNTDFYNKK